MATKLNEFTAADMRSAMIDCQLRPNDVIDPGVIAAMAAVAREDFVPAALASVAYTDRPVALGSGRVLNPPLVTGRMVMQAAVEAGDRVLLIGAGTGYVAAILDKLGAQIVAVEEDRSLSAAAPASAKSPSVRWIAGPLNEGAAAEAPFDVIIIDGAIEILPAAIADQLADGGRLITARRDGAVTRLVHGVKTGGNISLRRFADMDVAPLPGFAAPKSFEF